MKKRKKITNPDIASKLRKELIKLKEKDADKQKEKTKED